MSQIYIWKNYEKLIGGQNLVRKFKKIMGKSGVGVLDFLGGEREIGKSSSDSVTVGLDLDHIFGTTLTRFRGHIHI